MDRALAALVEDLSSPDAARAAAAREALAAPGSGAFHALVGAGPGIEAVRAALFAGLAAEDAPAPPPSHLRQLLRWAQSGWRAYQDPARAAEVQDALLALAEPLQALVPEILRQLGDSDPFVHGAAARDLETLSYYLGALGPEDGSAGAALRAALCDDCADVRAWTAAALANLAGEPGASVPALVPLLEDPAHGVRSAGAEALGAFGEEASPALPALAARLLDPHPEVACRAAAAVTRIGGASAEVVDGLLALSRRPESEARYHGLVAMASLGAPPAEAVEALTAAANGDPDEAVRKAAVLALEQLAQRHGSVAARRGAGKALGNLL